MGWLQNRQMGSAGSCWELKAKNFHLRVQELRSQDSVPIWDLPFKSCVTWAKALHSSSSLGFGYQLCHMGLIRLTPWVGEIMYITAHRLDSGTWNYLWLLPIPYVFENKVPQHFLYPILFHKHTNISTVSTFHRTYQLCVLEHGLSAFQSLASPCWCHRPLPGNRPRGPLHFGTFWQFLPRIHFAGPVTASSAFSYAVPGHN